MQQFFNFSRGAAFWLFWPALALVVWGELAAPVQSELHIRDKLLHFTAYFGLSILAWVALGGGRRGWWAALGLVLLGGALEIIQGQIGRDMSFWDEVANTIGVGTDVLAGTGFLHLSRLVAPGLAD